VQLTIQLSDLLTCVLDDSTVRRAGPVYLMIQLSVQFTDLVYFEIELPNIHYLYV